MACSWASWPAYLLVATGAANIVLIKWADEMYSEGLDGVSRRFEHPFVQTGCLFFGQFLCFLVFELTFKILRRRQDGSEERNILTLGNDDFSPRVFIGPALCEVMASIMFFSGLNFTSASSFGILQCAVIVFIGIFSGIYLNQRLSCCHWISSLVLAFGVGFLIINDYNLTQSNTVLTGNLMVLIGVCFSAWRYVLEEKHVKVLDVPPLRAIGWQGVFGLLFVTILYIPINFLKANKPYGNNTHNVLEDFLDAMAQMANNYLIVLAHCIFIVLVAINQYCGLRVTKAVSSVERVLHIDSIGIIAWSFASIYGLEASSNPWKIVIFILIICGGWIYRNFVFVPIYRHVMLVVRQRQGDVQTDPVTSQPADVI